MGIAAASLMTYERVIEVPVQLLDGHAPIDANDRNGEHLSPFHETQEEQFRTASSSIRNPVRHSRPVRATFTAACTTGKLDASSVTHTALPSRFRFHDPSPGRND